MGSAERGATIGGHANSLLCPLFWLLAPQARSPSFQLPASSYDAPEARFDPDSDFDLDGWGGCRDLRAHGSAPLPERWISLREIQLLRSRAADLSVTPGTKDSR
ncbi:MAG: hypothetical protein RI897_2668 [Verrucomicrobiota bacterium]